MKLINKSKNNLVLFEHLEDARSSFKSGLGLMGRKSMQASECLFLSGYWIHTFFMRFAIDVIYVNKAFTVLKIDRNLRPWRISLPVFKARHVFECNAHMTEKLDIQLGDQLYVGH